MIKLILKLMCVAALVSPVFSQPIDATQTIDIGRAVLTMPQNGEWIEISRNDRGVTYGGEVSGTTTAESRSYVLLNPQKEWLALLVVRASKSSVSNGTINWTGRCSGMPTQAVFDFTNGSPTRNDCLKVNARLSSEAYVGHASMEATKQALDAKALPLKGPAYLVNHFVGTQSGTFVATSALISHRALKNVEGAKAGEAHEGKPGVAWGHLMAAAARDSANSIRGRLTVPSFE